VCESDGRRECGRGREREGRERELGGAGGRESEGGGK
jgi:hypothetical protein